MIQVFSSCLSPSVTYRTSFLETGKDPDYNALLEARWLECVAENYLKITGIGLKRAGSEIRMNTPAQLYLAHCRLARARVEISIYSKLLDQGKGKSFRQGTVGFFDSFFRYTILILPNSSLRF